MGFLLFMGLLGLVGCGSPSSVSDADAAGQTKAASESDAGTGVNVETDVQAETELVYKSSMELQYAKKFAVDYYEGGYTMLTITADGTQFLIVPEEKNVPQALDENIVVLHQPLGNLYLVASAAMDMFRELDATDRIRFS